MRKPMNRDGAWNSRNLSHGKRSGPFLKGRPCDWPANGYETKNEKNSRLRACMPLVCKSGSFGFGKRERDCYFFHFESRHLERRALALSVLRRRKGAQNNLPSKKRFLVSPVTKILASFF